MRAVYYERFRGPIRVETVPDPVPVTDGVVLRVGASGLCRSDWHGWMGHDADVRLPHVPGHELAGEIVAAGGEVHRWRPGDRVTVPFASGCGTCRPCRSGDTHICDDYFQPGFTAWGSFAEFVALRYADNNLVRLPEEMDFVSAASLGCRFTTAFRAVVTQGRARPGEWVAVHGCGGVGLAAVMVASALGALVVAVDVRTEALNLAAQIGADHVLSAPDIDDLPGAIRELTGGGAAVSLDALGSRATCRNSVLCLAKRGRHVQVGLLLGDEGDPPMPMGAVIARELEIVGSHGMPARAFGSLLDLIHRGRLRPGRLVSQTISLDQAPAALIGLGEFRPVGVTVIDRL
ncbi:MAG: zinc-dependent alcohol dehydrogenase family protein [Limisphaerales bacterium]